jgi:phosphoribosylformylglycinamidine cyclo-ligase
MSMADQYRQAGVDITAGDEAVDRIAPLVESTRIAGVTGAFGSFAGFFDLAAAGLGADTVLVSGADGVGTKLKLAFMLDVHDTVGIDCVAMCVNDVLTQGARPLFFLDYLAVGKLVPARIEAIVRGVAAGCRQAGCALLGGETAEMPGFYPPDEYDLAGFAVGAAPRQALIDGSAVQAGDAVIGLASSGVHSNGFSLIRRVLAETGLALDAIVPELGEPLGAALLRPTRIYVAPILDLLAHGFPIRGMAHITGGGLPGNVPRILPSHLGVAIDQSALDRFAQPIFSVLQRAGGLGHAEMYDVFNMGVGYVVVGPRESAPEVLARLGEGAVLGEVVERGKIGGRDVALPKASS